MRAFVSLIESEPISITCIHALDAINNNGPLLT